MSALQSILEICWQDHVTNLEVLDHAESTSIESILIKAQLRWVGMSSACSSSASLVAFFKVNLPMAKGTQVDLRTAARTASKPICTGASSSQRHLRNMPETDHTGEASARFEETWRQRLIAARNRQHSATPALTTNFQCPHCSWLCASRLGFQSHLRVHWWFVAMGKFSSDLKDNHYYCSPSWSDWRSWLCRHHCLCAQFFHSAWLWPSHPPAPLSPSPPPPNKWASQQTKIQIKKKMLQKKQPPPPQTKQQQNGMWTSFQNKIKESFTLGLVLPWKCVWASYETKSKFLHVQQTMVLQVHIIFSNSSSAYHDCTDFATQHCP